MHRLHSPGMETGGLMIDQIHLHEKEFRTADQEVIDTATLFVNQLIEQAQLEVLKKKEGMQVPEKAAEEDDGDLSGFSGLLKRGNRWHSRARGLVNRLLTSLRICK